MHMEKLFVSGTFTGKGDRPIRIIETSIEKITGAPMLYAVDTETAERYYFSERFLIKR